MAKSFDELFRTVTREDVRLVSAYEVSQDAGFDRMHQNECALTLNADETLQFFAAQGDHLSKMLKERYFGLNAYPPLHSEQLRGAFAKYLQVPHEGVEVFAGSSDALQTLGSAFFRRGERVAFLRPSFSILSSLTSLWGACEQPIELDEKFDVRPESLLSEDVLSAPVVILCSPNNPTGKLIDSKLLSEFCDRAKGLVVVDEAYFEFAQQRQVDLKSMSARAVGSDNILVLRTLSKAWGAAGLRIGAIVGNPKWIRFLGALKKPYSVSLPAEILGSWILTHQSDLMHAMVKDAVFNCNRIETFFSQMSSSADFERSPLRFWQSAANFVLFETVRAPDILRQCYERRILIRDLGNLGMVDGKKHHFLRVSPWTEHSTTEFLEVVRDVMKIENS